MDIIKGGITAAKGYKATGIYAGIKKKKKDMALIISEVPCVAAGTFTTNLVKAAPVVWNQDIVKNSPFIQGVVINSGVANACTGKQGDANTKTMAQTVANEVGIPEDSVLVASTGVIGKQLPMDIIKEGIKGLVPQLGSTLEDGTMAAEAIMTTDTHSKEYAVEFEIGGKKVVVGGMSKGSGMIHPNMATLLGFITSDINISKELLTEALQEDVKDTYNMISVDGDTSTNDMILLLANGFAGNERITSKTEDYYNFCKALNIVNTYLAKQIAGDGEGATKLMEVQVVNAPTKDHAIKLSKSIITSSLCKTAVFGNDANCGRFICAMGYAGVDFDPNKVDLYFESCLGKILIVEDGLATDYSEELATKILSEKEVIIIADIKSGNETAIAWGCDLTYDYVKINADYRS